MTISDTDQIDLIATRPGEQVVKLIISDHLDWEDSHAHALLLQDKLNTYLEFVLRGQLASVSSVRLPESPEIVISVVALHAPPEGAAEFFSRVEASLAGYDIRFELDLSHVGSM